MTPRICLGTAQFGLSYGITNTAGQVSEAEVRQLLALAQTAGISWLDTAQAYGNAESVLGRQLQGSTHFRLITKLPAHSQPAFTCQDLAAWEEALQCSLERLGMESLEALLLHAPADLLKPGGHLLEAWLLDLRQRGSVQRLGVSIYEAEDLLGVNPALLDLVQLPLSLYDQRLLHDGTIARLCAGGTQIHARSIYLQGLLLTPSLLWPHWVTQEVLAHHKALEALAQSRGYRLIDLALGFAREQQDLEAVVVGLCSTAELAELLASWSAPSPWMAGDWSVWSLQHPGILDPRNWPC